MHVGAAGTDGDAGILHVLLGEALGDDVRTAQHALLTLLELGRRGELESGRLRRDHVHERPALLAGEDRRVDLLRDLGVVREDESRARAADRLVDGRGDDVGVRHRVRVQAGGDESGEVRHVDPQQRPDLVGDRAEALEVQLTGVGRPARDDDLRLVLDREAAHLLHVDDRRLGVDAVRDDVEEAAREVDLHAVGEVSALVEREAQQRVAGPGDGVQHRRIRCRTRVRLDIGELRAEQRLRPLDRELLGDVDLLAAAVIAATGVALGVLVGQHRALRLQHRHRHEVLGGDHLEIPALSLEFALEHLRDLRVDLRERRVEELVGHGVLLDCGASGAPRDPGY